MHHATLREGPRQRCVHVGASLQPPAPSNLNTTTSCIIATSRLSRRIVGKRRRQGSPNEALLVALWLMSRCPEATSRLIEFGVTFAREEVGEHGRATLEQGAPRSARCSPTSSLTPARPLPSLPKNQGSRFEVVGEFDVREQPGERRAPRATIQTHIADKINLFLPNKSDDAHP